MGTRLEMRVNREIPRFATNDKSKWRFLRPLRYRRNDNHLYIEPGDEGGGFAAAFIPLIYIKQCHPDARVFCGQRDLNFTFFVISLQAFGQMLKLGMTNACFMKGQRERCAVRTALFAPPPKKIMSFRMK
jgi:hypothetical protein